VAACTAGFASESPLISLLEAASDTAILDLPA
jgi:hypothetical protein